MKRTILAVLLVALFLVATAAPALARPVIGGAPPGTRHENPHAGVNPGSDNKTEPHTGGKHFQPLP